MLFEFLIILHNLIAGILFNNLNLLLSNSPIFQNSLFPHLIISPLCFVISMIVCFYSIDYSIYFISLGYFYQLCLFI